jgi:hypothetical protein
MREELEKRLEALRREFGSGQRLLADWERQQTATRNTLLRISGAIQVLEELLGGEVEAEPGKPDIRAVS